MCNRKRPWSLGPICAGESRDDAVTQRTLNAVLSSELLDASAVCRLSETRAPVHQYGLEPLDRVRDPALQISDVDWMAVNRKNLAAAAVVASNRR